MTTKFKKYTAEEKKEYWAKKDEQKKDLSDKLDKFLTDSLSSKGKMDELTAHYKISGLYNYSFYNSILILMQGGTICQSYAGWQKLGRQVKEKSHICVYRPMFKKEKDTEGKEKEKLIGFKLAPVFDISQTEGKELEYDHNSQEVVNPEDYEAIKAIVSGICGAAVVEEYTGKSRGYSDGKVLAVSTMSNNTDKLKTLFHEAGHHLMHRGDDRAETDQASREVEAEAVAYLCLSYLGVEYEMAKDYVSSWGSVGSKHRNAVIVKTADKIIKGLKIKKGEENALVDEE